MGKKLMIVDDSRFIYEDMKQMLKDTDYEIVSYCKSGEEALENYQSCGTPELVTMDVILPGMDGLEATKKLREKFPAVRVVIVSSLAYDETMASAKECGAVGFLFKPFEKTAMLQTLDNASALVESSAP